MTEDIVVDSNVFIVSLLDENLLDSNGVKQRALAIEFIEGIGDGRYTAHLPNIAIIEIVGIIRQKVTVGLASVIKNRLMHWVSLESIKLYDLEEPRARSAVDLVLRHNVSRRKSLSAPDAIFIGLAEELDMRLITLEKKFSKVSQRALVLT